MLHIRASWMAVALVALASCGGSGGTEPANNNNPGNGGGGGGGGGGAGVTVTVANNQYSPAAVSVSRGATVTWRWDSCDGDIYGGQVCTEHSVTFDDGGPSAAAQDEGSFQRSFATAGSYTYFCTSHGRGAMSGTVTVQ